jgi:hypothetical protein
VRWLIDTLPATSLPQPGDIVCYQRLALPNEPAHRGRWRNHVMLYLGNGNVIGACDIEGRVATRPVDYESSLGARQWQFIDPPSCRILDW